MVKIGNSLIGPGQPCFIVAEAGVNHNGSVSLAKKLIEAAKSAGADAVKFQTFRAENLVIKKAKKAGYQKTNNPESQYEMLKKLELSKEDFKKLSEYAKKIKIIFLSTPFDRESVDLLYDLNIPAFKISSGEITNFKLLIYIAKKGRPIILSTGMSNLREVKEAVNVLRDAGAKDLIILHCVSQYPVRIDDVNLRAMGTLRKVFKGPVGFSDHSLGITASLAAVAMGACMVEKHFTLSRNLKGPDHKASLEPDELRMLVKTARDIERSLGNGIKKPAKNEAQLKKIVRKSVVAKVHIPQGTVIREDMLEIKRPGSGIEPKYWDKVIDKKAKKNIKKDALIKLNDLI